MRDIHKVRAEIASSEGELAAHAQQRRSREQVAAYLHDAVALWEQEGASAIDMQLMRCAAGEPAEFLTIQTTAYTPAQMLRIDIPLGPVLVSLFGADAVREVLTERLDIVPAGLAPEAKARRIAALRERLDALGYEEEVLIRKSWGTTTPIEYRGEMDPRYVLTAKAET